MNKLYYVCAYSFRNNDWARILVTVSPAEAERGDSAEVVVEAYFDDTDRVVRSCDFICDTADTVWQEH